MADVRQVPEDRLFTPAVVVLVLLSFIMGISEFIVIGVLPDISEDMGIEYTLVGSLVSVFALSYAVLAPTITGTCARFGRRRLFFAMAVLFLVSNLWTVISSSYVSIAASRVLTAASSGALLSVGITYTMDLVTPRFRAKAVAMIFSGFSIASAFGVPMGSAMSHALGWRTVFVLVLILGAATVAAALRVLPSRDPEVSERRKGSSLRMMADPRILLAMGVTMCGGGGVYVMYTYITPILEDELGIPAAAISVALMALGVCLLMSNVLSGKVASKGGIRTLRLSFVIEAGLLVLLPIALGSFITGFGDLILICLLYYLANSPIQIHMMEIAQRDYPQSVILASSLNPSSFNIGIMVASLIGGAIYDSVGAVYLGYGSGAMVLMASVFSILLCYICRRNGNGSSMT